MSLLATCLGHPRIGVARELKTALESFWAKKSFPASDLDATAQRYALAIHWTAMKSAESLQTSCQPTTFRSTTTCSI